MTSSGFLRTQKGKRQKKKTSSYSAISGSSSTLIGCNSCHSGPMALSDHITAEEKKLHMYLSLSCVFGASEGAWSITLSCIYYIDMQLLFLEHRGNYLASCDRLL